MFRIARESDLPQLRQIWKDIFHDTDSFINWQMNRRFVAELCAVCEEGGRIVSCLYGYPLPLSFGEKTVDNILVSGVATLPEYRGKGLMKRLFEFYLNHLYVLDVPLISLTPANPAYYGCIGAVSLTQSVIISCGKVTEKTEMPFKIEKADISSEAERLKACYERFASRYSGVSVRKDYFEIKMSEYMEEGCECMTAANKKGDVLGYVVYITEGNLINCSEAVGENEAIKGLLSMFKLPFKAVLPPDFPLKNISGNIARNAYNSMGRIVSLKKFLTYFPELRLFSKGICDDIISSNNVSFTEKLISISDFLYVANAKLNLKPRFTTDFY